MDSKQQDDKQEYIRVCQIDREEPYNGVQVSGQLFVHLCTAGCTGEESHFKGSSEGVWRYLGIDYYFLVGYDNICCIIY